MEKMKILWRACTFGIFVSASTMSLPAQEMAIETFVRQTYISGIPYDEANAFDADNVPVLLEMLEDENESRHWGNIVVTLSIIGDERALDPIIGYIERQDRDQLSDADYRAKSGALMALGYLINKTGNMKAINYLVESIDPTVWDKRDVAWNIRHIPPEFRDANLSSMAILGLALSGRSEAAEAINLDLQPGSDLQPAIQRLQPAVQQLQPAIISGVIASALATYQQVAANGLSEYYRKSAEGFGR